MSNALPTPAAPKFGAIILAAGASSRLGQPKQLLRYRERPLVVLAAEVALAAGASPVAVVLGAHAKKIRPVLAALPVLLAENPAWREGMASSIQTGLRALDVSSASALDTVLLTVCDQPHFSAQAIHRLRAALDERHTLAATRHVDGAGVPAIFSRIHFPALLALRGTEGARRLIASHPDATAVVDLPELALDIDTPADWQRLNSR